MSLSMSKTNGSSLGPSTFGIGDNSAGGRYVGNIAKDCVVEGWGIEGRKAGKTESLKTERLCWESEIKRVAKTRAV